MYYHIGFCVRRNYLLLDRMEHFAADAVDLAAVF